MPHFTRISSILIATFALSSCSLIAGVPSLSPTPEQKPPLPEVITFDVQLDEGWELGVVPLIAEDSEWLAVTDGTAPTVYELTNPGCLLVLQVGRISSLGLTATDDLEASSIAMAEHLGSNQFEAQSYRWPAYLVASSVEALLVASDDAGSTTVTVVRAFETAQTQVLVSLTCVPGVDTLEVFRERVASETPFALRPA